MDKRGLIISGNDTRTIIVDYAHSMSLMWKGPKLVTTPGSNFSALCGLLYESASGIADESLAGAINRYARSENRRRTDREELELQSEDHNDNFLSERNAMKFSQKERERYGLILEQKSLSDLARQIVQMKILKEKANFQTARNAYGPHQVYFSQLNEEQQENAFGGRDLVGAMHKLDRSLGELRRVQRKALDRSSS